MNPNPDNSSRPAASGKPKLFFPPGSTGATTMRLRAELQHEEAKLRIFKIFMALFVLCVGVFLVYSGISYHAESGAKAKRLAEAKQTLAKLESGLADTSLSELWTTPREDPDNANLNLRTPSSASSALVIITPSVTFPSWTTALSRNTLV